MPALPPPSAATRRRLLALVSALPLAAIGCASAEPPKGVISGAVLYRERMMLPPGAVVKVSLADVSRADAPARVLAQTIVATEGRSSPFPYTLQYDTAQIDPRMRYALQARIELDGKLLFINTTHHAAFGPQSSTDILVQSVAR